MAEKPHLNLVFIGHVDHGKSTLVGRVLYDTGNISEQDMRKLKEEAAKVGKATFEFAFAMDSLKEERERGVTIDVAHQEFKTDKYYFTIIDCPGHRDFVKNMITGTSQGDAAVLVCSAHEGPQTQTREHLFLAKTLGINQLLIAVNKMDATTPPYSEKRFNEVRTEMEGLLKNVRYKVENVPFVPVSAYVGDNINKPTTNLPWYKGPTLVDLLNSLKVPPQLTDKPLRLPIQDVYTIQGIGTVPVGRVNSGVLKPGETVIFQPSGKKAIVKSVEMHHQQLPQAVPGDNVGFSVKDIERKDIKRGEVIGHENNQPTVAKSFKAQLAVLNHPSGISAGYTPVFHCHTAQIACRFEDILTKFDPKSNEIVEITPKEFEKLDAATKAKLEPKKAEIIKEVIALKNGDIAMVKIVPARPMVIELARDFPQLGRFAIRDMGQTVAAGVCVEIEKRT